MGIKKQGFLLITLNKICSNITDLIKKPFVLLNPMIIETPNVANVSGVLI